MIRSLSVLTAVTVLSFAAAHAITADEQFRDPQQQALYERLTEEVRCLVCQNQTIGDSSAPLAADLRREIRDMVRENQSEQQIKAFLTERYGDFVLYRPRYSGATSLLWIAPGALLLLGAAVLWRILRRRSALPVPPDEESV